MDFRQTASLLLLFGAFVGGTRAQSPAEPAPAKNDDKHWAFRPVRRPAVPAMRDASWVLNPVDAFILARLEKQGLKPAPRADKGTLLRRVYLDLIGLPPGPTE